MEERKQAEILWVRSAQRSFTNLKNLTKPFNLFKDEHGVLRCGGRLANTEVPLVVKVAGSNRQQSTLKRPIQLLYPLEIRSDISTVISSKDTSESTSEPEFYAQDRYENADSVDPPISELQLSELKR